MDVPDSALSSLILRFEEKFVAKIREDSKLAPSTLALASRGRIWQANADTLVPVLLPHKRPGHNGETRETHIRARFEHEHANNACTYSAGGITILLIDLTSFHGTIPLPSNQIVTA